MSSCECAHPVGNQGRGEVGESIHFAASTLCTGRFTDLWDFEVRSVIDSLTKECGLAPLLLLPTDIMLEDYEPFYEVYCSHEADEKLESLINPQQSQEPRLICIDIGLDQGFGLSTYTAFLNRVSTQGSPNGSHLVVFTDSAIGVIPELFDQHIELHT